jgi:hypothetical protein
VEIVTRANLLHALASVSREAQPSAQGDEVIRSLLLAEFANQKRGLLPPIYVNPIVRNGIVELWGAITDERERHALVVAAENVAGVKEVRDHVVLVDPVSGIVLYHPENKVDRLLCDLHMRRYNDHSELMPVLSLSGRIPENSSENILLSARGDDMAGEAGIDPRSECAKVPHRGSGCHKPSDSPKRVLLQRGADILAVS